MVGIEKPCCFREDSSVVMFLISDIVTLATYNLALRAHAYVAHRSVMFVVL